MLLFAALWLVLNAPQNNPPPPAHDMHSGMDERGEKGMGFSQTATTHHFLLLPTGGAIQVEANDPNDKESRDDIRMHLHHIQHAFQSGDFNIPMFVHDTTPPGVPVMKERAKNIHYSIEDTAKGGRVLIQTTDPAALDAIHSFLRFQITEHKTGDPLK